MTTGPFRNTEHSLDKGLDTGSYAPNMNSKETSQTAYQVFEATQPGHDWIRILSDVLGEAEFVEFPDDGEPTDQESVTYFVPQATKDNPPYVTLTISRLARQEGSNFLIELRAKENGKKRLFSHAHIGKLGVNYANASVEFIPVLVNGGEQKALVTLFRSGVIDPSLECLNKD